MIAPTEEHRRFRAKRIRTFAFRRLDRPGEKDYILKTFTPSSGRRHRVLLLCSGQDAVETKTVAGPIFERRSLESAKGNIRHLRRRRLRRKTPDRINTSSRCVQETEDHCKATLKPSASRAERNLVENVSHDHPERIERTLVIIKPDNWVVPSSAGNHHRHVQPNGIAHYRNEDSADVRRGSIRFTDRWKKPCGKAGRMGQSAIEQQLQVLSS